MSAMVWHRTSIGYKAGDACLTKMGGVWTLAYRGRLVQLGRKASFDHADALIADIDAGVQSCSLFTTTLEVDEDHRIGVDTFLDSSLTSFEFVTPLCSTVVHLTTEQALKLSSDLREAVRTIAERGRVRLIVGPHCPECGSAHLRSRLAGSLFTVDCVDCGHRLKGESKS